VLHANTAHYINPCLDSNDKMAGTDDMA